MISSRAGDRVGRVVLRCQSCGLEKERASSLADLDQFWPDLAAKVRKDHDNDNSRAEKAAAQIAGGGSRGKDKK